MYNRYFGFNMMFTCVIFFWSIDDVPCIYETWEGQPRGRDLLKGNMVGVTSVSKVYMG